MEIAVIGIDLGKNSCSLVGLDQAGAVVKRRRMRPESIPAFTKTMAACVVAMEACYGAHHLGRLPGCSGSHRAPDVTRICAPIRQGAEERRPGRGGDRRGGHPVDDALRRDQE